MTRAKIMELSIHRSDRTGVNTQKNVRVLARAHAARLKELGRMRPAVIADEDEDAEPETEFRPEELTVEQYWFCESYDNPGAYCVYDDEQRGHQTCLYCNVYLERQ